MSYLDSLFGLDGSTAVVTGATSGLGAASALALARAGAKVVLGGRDRARGERVVRGIADGGGSAELELADLADADQARAFADRVLERHAPVDILVNAAGVFARGDAVDLTLEGVGSAVAHQRHQHVSPLPAVRQANDRARPGQDRQLLLDRRVSGRPRAARLQRKQGGDRAADANAGLRVDPPRSQRQRGRPV